MGKVCKITDGSTSINFITAEDWYMAPGGVQQSPLTDAHLVGDDPIAGKTMVITYRLASTAADHDALKTKISALIALIRKAAQHQRTDWQLDPVWIEEQGRTETNPRYAMVLRVMELDRMSILLKPFDIVNYIINFGLTFELEFPWRPEPPQSLPTALTLTKSDGPADDTLVHLANFRDDVDITHFKEIDQGVVWAADFESGDPDHMWIADNAALSTGNIDFYVAGFFTLESKAVSCTLMGKWDNVAVNNEYFLYYNQVNDRFEFYIFNAAGAHAVVIANTFGALAIATEYFITVWHTAGTSELGIQINDTAPDTIAAGINPQDGTRDFTLGDAMGGGISPYDGLMKSCGMWKTECTDALRTCLYNEGVPKFYAELAAAEKVGLQAYWEFGSGGLAFVNDSHGANHLTNAGATQVNGTAIAYSDIGVGDTLFPAVVAQHDSLIIGSTDQPLKHIVISKLGTVGALTDTTLKLYSSSTPCSWTELVLGTDYTCYPKSTLEDCLEQNAEQIVINIQPISTATKQTIDAVSAHWIMIREEHAAPVYATNPVMHATLSPYAQKSNYIEIAAAQLKGDHPIRSLLRMRCPAGGGSSPGLGTPSRFILGARSFHLGADEFEPWLNAGNQDNPAGWAITYDADTSSIASPDAPGGYEAVCTFATETGMIPRCIFTGTNKLKYYRGRFEVFVLYWQNGGSDRDIDFEARFIVGTDAVTSPKKETAKTVSSLLGDRWTVASLGEIKLPFGEITAADELEENLIIKIMAELTTGTADVSFGAIFLCPLGEWSGGLDDPLTDTDDGPSALRGATLIDFDNGVLARRAQKFLVQSDADIIPGENWNYSGSLPSIEPARQTRIYVLQLRYDTDWAVAPLIAQMGMHMTAEVFVHPGYVLLRGAD